MRATSAVAAVVFAWMLGGCANQSVEACECAAPVLSVVALAGTTVEIVDGGCTGRCEGASGSACGQFLVSSSTARTCTVKATAAGGSVESLSVTFADRGCCGVQPDPLVWNVGE